MNSTSPVIELKDVCFSYNKREILHNVNIAIPDGSMTAIVGPNGGGKTTLLHLMLGIHQPDRGSVSLLGKRPKETRTRTGYVPQKLEVDPNFPASVMDVVLMGLLSPSRHRLRGKALQHKALKSLASAGVEHLANQSFSRLSGGEKQKVLIASALVADPELLLLDEPTANVDPRSEHELYQWFQELNKQVPVVFVSHNLNVVSRHVSHVVCVNHTAAIHPIAEVLENTFTELYGGKLAVIHHGSSCHINDPSHALNQPHGAHSDCNHGCDCDHSHHESNKDPVQA